MDEQVFLTAPGIQVTSSRIEINGQTFATRNVGSVRVDRKGASTLAVMMAIAGAFLLFSSVPVFGLFLLLAGAGATWHTMNDARLVLLSGGGEVVALRAKAEHLDTIKNAIAQAISVR